MSLTATNVKLFSPESIIMPVENQSMRDEPAENSISGESQQKPGPTLADTTFKVKRNSNSLISPLSPLPLCRSLKELQEKKIDEREVYNLRIKPTSEETTQRTKKKVKHLISPLSLQIDQNTSQEKKIPESNKPHLKHNDGTENKSKKRIKKLITPLSLPPKQNETPPSSPSSESHVSEKDLLTLSRTRSETIVQKPKSARKPLTSHSTSPRKSSLPELRHGIAIREQHDRQIEKRLIVQEQLKDIHGCLKKVLIDRTLMLYLKDEGWLHYRPYTSAEVAINQSTFDQVLTHIYMTINKSLFEGNYFYSDPDGNIFSLYQLDKLVSIKYPDTTNQVRKEVKKLLREEKHLIMSTTSRLTKIVSHRSSQSSSTSKTESDRSSQFADTESTSGTSLEIDEDPCAAEPEYLVRLKHLSLPEVDVKEWTECTKFYRNILQKLYPLSTPEYNEQYPIVPPKVFLYHCIMHINPEEFFGHCTYLLNLTEVYMPYRQKITLLNFCKSYLLNIPREQKLFIQPTKKEFSFKVYERQRDHLIRGGCEEVELIKKGSIIRKEKMSKNCKCVLNEINLIVQLKELESTTVKDFAKILSHDLKIISASTFCNFNIKSLLNDKVEGIREPDNYGNHITYFIRALFLNLIKKELSSDNTLTPQSIDAVRSNFVVLYNFFLHVGQESYNNHDYLSTMAIFAGIDFFPIQKIINRAPKFPPSMQKLIAFKSQIFHPRGNYEHLVMRYEQCKQDKVFYIPFLGAWSTKIIHEVEIMDSYSEFHNLSAFQKMALFTKEETSLTRAGKNFIVIAQDYLEDFKMQFETLAENSKILTNLRYRIYKSGEIPDEISDALYALFPR